MPFLDDFGSIMADLFVIFFSSFLPYRRKPAMRFIFHAKQTRLHAKDTLYLTNRLPYLIVMPFLPIGESRQGSLWRD